MVHVEKQLFTVEDYYKMADSGIIRPGDRVELIRGEIFKMSPIRSQHSGVVDILYDLLSFNLRGKFTVKSQNPIRIDQHTEPEPDLVISKYRKDMYRARHARPSDIHLIIEVADSSLVYDRSVKVPLYAEAGIPEYWIVNLQDKQIEVFRQPNEGKYETEELSRKGGKVFCEAIGFELTVDDIFE